MPSAGRISLRCAVAALAFSSRGINAQAGGSNPTPALNITAISAASNASTLECWQFGPLAAVSAPGVSGASALLLGGAASSVSYTVFPANTTGGPHHAPRLQLVVFLSGLARITLPSSSGGGNGTATSFDVRGGRNGIIVAADTRDVSGLGHTTDYPGDEPTVVLQMPIAAGRPGFGRYSVLHEGPCTEEEMSGL
ncbi:hypothetical protein RB595_008898 [Gaeumannomyces hyphopodioides]